MNKLKQNWRIYKKELRNKGLLSFIRARVQKLVDILMYRLINLTQQNKQFTFNHKRYYYSLSRYNYTWKNERSVEIPIIYKLLENNKNKDVLEVGNVLSHYYLTSHDVLDKYEKASGVINEDVVDYSPSKKYDLIVSISTLEHVGWEEKPQEPQKIIPAIKKLKSLLKENGQLIITLPLGYSNPFLNKAIQDQTLGFDDTYYLKRISHSNKWKQVEFADVKNSKYNSPFPNANAILVGIITA